jgi:hypothetical protein
MLIPLCWAPGRADRVTPLFRFVRARRPLLPSHVPAQSPGGMAPEYLSPRPVEWFKYNRQDQNSGNGIGRGAPTGTDQGRAEVSLAASDLVGHEPPSRRGVTPWARAASTACCLHVTLLTSLIVFAGCAGPGQLFLQNPISLDHLDGNYQRLASCTYEQLARRPGRWSLINSDEQHTVIIAHAKGTQAQWELSFVNEEGGRQTRLEATSLNGSFPSDHELALVRACAA